MPLLYLGLIYVFIDFALMTPNKDLLVDMMGDVGCGIFVLCVLYLEAFTVLWEMEKGARQNKEFLKRYAGTKDNEEGEEEDDQYKGIEESLEGTA